MFYNYDILLMFLFEWIILKRFYKNELFSNYYIMDYSAMIQLYIMCYICWPFVYLMQIVLVKLELKTTTVRPLFVGGLNFTKKFHLLYNVGKVLSSPY